MNHAQSSLVTISLLLTLLSCGHPNAQFIDINNQSWKRTDTIEFKIDSLNWQQPEKQIYIRHTNDYEYQNLWVKLSIESRDSVSKFTRREFQMAKPDGQWLGKKSGGIYLNKQPLTDLNCSSDTCILKIIHNMRVDPVLGVQSLGVGFK